MPATVVVIKLADGIPTRPVDGKLTLVYWNICGLAQPIRYALAAAGVDYVDVRIEAGAPGPEYKGEWFAAKPGVGKAVDFANLPYLLDGDVALSQSGAILRYLARKFDLGADPAQAHRLDLLLEEGVDFDKASTTLCYNNPDGLKSYCEKVLPRQLAEWERVLGDSPFYLGDHLSIADLKVYETLRKLVVLEALPEINTKGVISSKGLTRFINTVESVPRLKEYRASRAFLEHPFNNPHSQVKEVGSASLAKRARTE